MYAVAFGTTSGGRRLLVSGGYDGKVRLWDPGSGDPIGECLTGHVHSVLSLAFNGQDEDRTRLASGGEDGTVRLWDLDTGQQIGEPLMGHSNLVNSVVFGTGINQRPLLVSAGTDSTIRLWDPASGQPLKALCRRVPATQIAARGNLFAIADAEGLSIIAFD